MSAKEKLVLHTVTEEGTTYYYSDNPPRSAEVLPPDCADGAPPFFRVELIAFPDDSLTVDATDKDEAHRRALAWVSGGRR